jgi:L-iditol 2-dehydrogenase
MGLAGKPVTLPFDLVCFHELTVTSGLASTPSSWRKALDLVRERGSSWSRS